MAEFSYPLIVGGAWRLLDKVFTNYPQYVKKPDTGGLLDDVLMAEWDLTKNSPARYCCALLDTRFKHPGFKEFSDNEWDIDQKPGCRTDLSEPYTLALFNTWRKKIRKGVEESALV
jgi:hypothetical protein